MTLFYYTIDQIRVSSICVNFCGFFFQKKFWNSEYWKYTVFRTFLLHALTFWAEVLHMTLFYCAIHVDQVWVSSICVNFCGSYAPFETQNTEKKNSFLHFSPKCFEILSWNFAYDFVLLYYRSSSSVVNMRQFLLELCPCWNSEYWKYSFPRFSFTYWAEIFHMTLFNVL